MAKKVVDLTIRLKDGVSSGLRKITGGLKMVAGGFASLAKIGVAAGGALTGAVVAVAKAWSDQESVNNKMKAAFDAAGEAGTIAVAKWGAFATAIQRATSLGDEEVMSLVTLGKVMGISNNRLEEATKGAIGLSKAFGIDLNSSMKMVALALQGEYTMLNRYIPQLRAANSETEKAAILQKAMANGFKLAEAELNTIAGQFRALKGVVGDALQEFGRVLFGDGGLTRGLEMVKEKLIEMIEGGAIEQWAKKAKGAFDVVVDTIKMISKGGADRDKALRSIGEVLSAAFKTAASKAIEVLALAVPRLGEAFGKAIKAGFTGALQATTDRAVIEKQLRQQGKLEETTISGGGLGGLMSRDDPAARARNKAKIDKAVKDAQEAYYKSQGLDLAAGLGGGDLSDALGRHIQTVGQGASSGFVERSVGGFKIREDMQGNITITKELLSEMKKANQINQEIAKSNGGVS